MIAVDANVLVYAANEDSEFHVACRDWLELQRKRPSAWFTTWSVLYEFMRVTTHPRVLRDPWRISEAWGFVTALLACPGFAVLTPTEQHVAVTSEVIAELPHLTGNIVHDLHVAILLREHGIRRICTRDTDFHQFKFLEVVDPIGL